LSNKNLKKEGVTDERMKFVGNIMIDTLEANRSKAEKLSVSQIITDNLIEIGSNTSVPQKDFAILTLHRPSNVDNEVVLSNLVDLFCDEISKELPLIWTIHPRTVKQLKNFGLWSKLLNTNNITLLQPLGYHEMLKLNIEARIMLTDSGGLQEECTVLGTPCLTLRWNTERPITLRENGGASILVGNNIERIRNEFFDTLKQNRKPERPELWDGKTAERCLKAILENS